VIVPFKDLFRFVVRRFDEFEFDQRGTVVDTCEAEDVEWCECFWKEWISDRIEVGHFRSVHLRMEGHEEVQVGLVEEMKVFEGSRGRLEMLDQVVEGRFRNGFGSEIEGDNVESLVHRSEEGSVKCGTVCEREFAESELCEREVDRSRIRGILEVGFAA